MFSNIGWVEIFVILVIAVIIIGPEKLPDVLKDIRAAVYAARKAIRNARAELDGVSEEFEEFREPLNQAAEWGRMGPRKAITKALFDDDDSYLDVFDPKKQMADAGMDTSVRPIDAAKRALREDEQAQQQSRRPEQDAPASRPVQRDPRTTRTHQNPPPAAGEGRGNYETGGGFSWADIT